MGFREFVTKKLLNESIQEMVESQVSERMNEMAFEITGDPDGDSNLYRRLTATERELSPVVHDRMLDIAYYLWLTNPAAKDVIEKYVDFVVGEGIGIVANEPDVQEIIDDFMENNNREDGFEGDVRDLGIYGELIFPVAVNDADGSIDLGYIDPKEIKEIKYSSDNRLKPVLALLKGTPEREERSLKIVDRDIDPESETFGMFSGEAFYFSINRPRNVRRGTSDLLCIADWVDAYDQFLFNFVEGSGFKNAFVYDVKLNGMDEKQIQEYAKKQKPPTPGSVKYHNENVEWDVVSPDLRAMDNTDAARLIRSMVHWGSALPEHWAGFGDYANRATASEMGDPPIKRLTRRQNYVKACVRKIIRFIIDQAILAKKLNNIPLEPDERKKRLGFSINMPEMSSKDMSKIATALSQATNSLVLATQNEWLTNKTARKVFANMAEQLGTEINVEEEETALENEDDEDEDEFGVDDEGVRSALANATQGSEE